MRRLKRCAVVVLALLPALAACGGHRDREPQSARSTGPLYSPNGEPLSGGPLGHPSCQEALAGWFDRIDAHHVGTIDLAAFLADARRQFAAMDLNHDGQITPDELAQYRMAYAAERRVAEAADDDTLRPDQSASRQSDEPGGGGGHGGRGGGGEGGAGGGRHGGGSGGADPAGGGRGGDKGDAHPSTRDIARDRPDPVMIAAVTLRNSVSLAQFLAYEQENFAELDLNHDGRLSKDELTRSCPKP
jgi:hypothetical protein